MRHSFCGLHFWRSRQRTAQVPQDKVGVTTVLNNTLNGGLKPASPATIALHQINDMATMGGMANLLEW